eukprot:1477770-Rhodomonas_salina.1
MSRSGLAQARIDSAGCDLSAVCPCKSCHRDLVHPEIQCAKPQFQDKSYLECGFLCLISGCSGLVRVRAVTCDGSQCRQ